MRSERTRWASWADYRRDEQKTTEIPLGGDLPCALLYPADYSVGMSNLGYHYIYRALRERGISAERFFASPIPYRSVEGDTLFERFEVLLAGVSYEGDIVQLVRWLREGGVEPFRCDRETTSSAPLIGAGGAITYINPLSLSGIADFIVLGDGLPVIPHLAEVLRTATNRRSALDTLASHPSIFVPALHLRGGAFLERARRTEIAEDYGFGNWTTPRSAFGNTLLLELQRGCLWGCAYCTLPTCFGPFRQRALPLVLQDLTAVAGRADFTQIGLVTPEASDYGALPELLREAERMRKGVSFASLRIDGMTREMVRALALSGRRRITVAPETGRDVLRETTGKSFTNDDVLVALAMARSEGITSVKLYFMIGLPGEEDADIEAIPALCGRIRTETGMRVAPSVSPFVPKPGTLWQGMPFDAARLKKKYRKLLQEGKRCGMLDSFQGTSVREATLEYALSWADSTFSERVAVGAGESALRFLNEAVVDRDRTLAELSALGL